MTMDPQIVKKLTDQIKALSKKVDVLSIRSTEQAKIIKKQSTEIDRLERYIDSVNNQVR